ncbi:hypothetical protein [uncultured Ruthenibacterium sp.]|uniref:hypothetical protein n=1 Tax=uncultured Ruthenibacterium sp. TaxID=1905347 RepID=UPI00349E77B8
MEKYRLKVPGNMGKKVKNTYQKVEDSTVGLYKHIENGVVSAYQKVEDAFVESFLEKTENQDESDK